LAARGCAARGGGRGAVVKGMGWGHGQLERGKRVWRDVRAGRESQGPLQRGRLGLGLGYGTSVNSTRYILVL